MDRPFNRKEKFELFLQRDGALMMSRVLTGIALGVVVGLVAAANAPLISVAGITSIVGCCLGGVAFGAYASQTIHRYKRKVLLDFYREEIAAMTGKSPDSLTLDDLERMRQTPDKGGKGSYAIAESLSVFDEKRNYYIAIQALSAALVVGGLFALSAMAVPAGVIGAMAVAGYNLVYQTVDSVGNILTGMDEKTSLTKSIRDVAGIIERGGLISSTRVLELFVEARPELSRTIEAQYHQPYSGLPVDVKRQLVQELNPRFHLYKITDDVNLGHINPQELAFIVHGQVSGVPRDSHVTRPHVLNDQMRAKATELSDHTAPMPVSNKVLKADGPIQPDDDGAIPDGEMHLNMTPRNVLHADKIRAGRGASTPLDRMV